MRCKGIPAGYHIRFTVDQHLGTSLTHLTDREETLGNLEVRGKCRQEAMVFTTQEQIFDHDPNPVLLAERAQQVFGAEIKRDTA